jgi:hypothetical protein
MATNKYTNSTKEMMPTIKFSTPIFSSLHLLAEADVQPANDKEGHNDPDIDDVLHTFSSSRVDVRSLFLTAASVRYAAGHNQ